MLSEGSGPKRAHSVGAPSQETCREANTQRGPAGVWRPGPEGLCEVVIGTGLLFGAMKVLELDSGDGGAHL